MMSTRKTPSPAPLLALASALALAACGSSKEAAIPRGEWRVLNAAQWDVDPAQVSVPPMPAIEGKR